MDILFLDANVMFSAAYHRDAGLRRLWKLEDVELISSLYAVDEARRNLREPAQRDRLNALLEGIRMVAALPERQLPDGVTLPVKDQPILKAALAAGATHLITGDISDFGHLFDTTVEGLWVLTPGAFIRARGRAQE